jgi:mRNA interferase HigB
LKQAAAEYRSLEAALDVWYRIAKAAIWKNIEDVRKTYPHADPVEGLTVFNIKGNRYRLIVKIEYQWQKIFVKDVLTHAEYNRGDWKK